MFGLRAYQVSPDPFPGISRRLGNLLLFAQGFTRFSRISFAEDGRSLSYTRGNERHDTLEFLLFIAMLESSIHPALWRLFPRPQIPDTFQSAEYEAARRALCRLLFHFRGLELAARLTADLPNKPLMIGDESAGRIALGDSNNADEEIEKAILEVG